MVAALVLGARGDHGSPRLRSRRLRARRDRPAVLRRSPRPPGRAPGGLGPRDRPGDPGEPPALRRSDRPRRRGADRRSPSRRRAPTRRSRRCASRRGSRRPSTGTSSRTSARRSAATDQKRVVKARIRIEHDGDDLGVYAPAVNIFPNSTSAIGTPSVRTGLLRDVYLTLVSSPTDGGRITLGVAVNPMVVWLWIGGGFLVVGTVDRAAAGPPAAAHRARRSSSRPRPPNRIRCRHEAPGSVDRADGRGRRRGRRRGAGDPGRDGSRVPTPRRVGWWASPRPSCASATSTGTWSTRARSPASP